MHPRLLAALCLSANGAVARRRAERKPGAETAAAAGRCSQRGQPRPRRSAASRCRRRSARSSRPSRSAQQPAQQQQQQQAVAPGPYKVGGRLVAGADEGREPSRRSASRSKPSHSARTARRSPAWCSRRASSGSANAATGPTSASPASTISPGDRPRRQGRRRLGTADRLCRRSDRHALCRPQGHGLRAGRSRLQGDEFDELAQGHRHRRRGLGDARSVPGLEMRADAQARHRGGREARHALRAVMPEEDAEQPADAAGDGAVRQDRFRAGRRGRARWATTRSATARTAAAGRSSVSSAATSKPSPIGLQICGARRNRRAPLCVF